MAKLFRNVRMQFIDQNKTGKYLKYAIGEIILLVIGILIALQLDTWHQDVIDHRKENQYLVNLRQDLVNQIDLLDRYKQFESLIVADANVILHHYDVNGLTNLDTIYSYINDLMVRVTFTSVATTFNELNATGNLNLIRTPALRTALVTYFQNQERFGDITQNNNTQLVDQIIVPKLVAIGVYSPATLWTPPMQKIIPNIPFSKDQISISPLVSISADLLKKPENQLAFINLVNFRKVLSMAQITRLADIKQQASDLKSSIEEEIKKKGIDISDEDPAVSD